MIALATADGWSSWPGSLEHKHSEASTEARRATADDREQSLAAKLALARSLVARRVCRRPVNRLDGMFRCV